MAARSPEDAVHARIRLRARATDSARLYRRSRGSGSGRPCAGEPAEPGRRRGRRPGLGSGGGRQQRRAGGRHRRRPEQELPGRGARLRRGQRRLPGRRPARGDPRPPGRGQRDPAARQGTPPEGRAEAEEARAQGCCGPGLPRAGCGAGRRGARGPRGVGRRLRAHVLRRHRGPGHPASPRGGVAAGVDPARRGRREQAEPPRAERPSARAASRREAGGARAAPSGDSPAQGREDRSAAPGRARGDGTGPGDPRCGKVGCEEHAQGRG